MPPRHRRPRDGFVVLHLQGCATGRDSPYRHHGDPCRVDRHLSGGVFLAMVSGCL